MVSIVGPKEAETDLRRHALDCLLEIPHGRSVNWILFVS